MNAIVGLGNPGRTYQLHRHNVGNNVVRYIASAEQSRFKKSLFFLSLIAEGSLGDCRTLFVLPTTFMNLSGKAVARIAKRKHIEPQDILVICDDIDLPLGIVRYRHRGSDGGHNGLRSISQLLGTREFPRLKIGIGRPGNRADVRDYVLSDFTRSEQKSLEEAFQKAQQMCGEWIQKRKES
ncbi:aminoacyl-tRNA hydrolase [Candidatus Omnitrophota bacterium]